MLHFITINFLHYYQYSCFLFVIMVCLNLFLHLSFFVSVCFFCSLNRPLPLKVLIHSHTPPLSCCCYEPVTCDAVLSSHHFLIVTHSSLTSPLCHWSPPNTETQCLSHAETHAHTSRVLRSCRARTTAVTLRACVRVYGFERI